MAEVSHKTLTKVTRDVRVILSEEEFIEVPGDRKSGGGRRVGRLTELLITYDFTDGRWSTGWGNVKAFKQQQKADGSWGEPKWESWTKLGADRDKQIKDQYRPTAEVTIKIEERN